MQSIGYWASQRVTPPPFNPLTLCNPLHVGWASDPNWTINNNDAVASWPNRGSVGGDPAQATAANRPIYHTSIPELNNKSAVVFDGENDYLLADITEVPQPWSMVVVAARGSLTSFNGRVPIVGRPGASSPCWLAFARTSNNVYAVNAGSSLDGGNSGNTNPHVMIGVGNGGASRVVVDAADLAYGNAGTNSITHVIIGQNGEQNAQFNGPIAFWAVYADDVTAHPDYAKLLNGLSDYYQIPLGS